MIAVIVVMKGEGSDGERGAEAIISLTRIKFRSLTEIVIIFPHERIVSQKLSHPHLYPSCSFNESVHLSLPRFLFIYCFIIYYFNSEKESSMDNSC